VPTLARCCSQDEFSVRTRTISASISSQLDETVMPAPVPKGSTSALLPVAAYAGRDLRNLYISQMGGIHLSLRVVASTYCRLIARCCATLLPRHKFMFRYFGLCIVSCSWVSFYLRSGMVRIALTAFLLYRALFVFCP
jgi:hypothetical protein